jgi:hypothetical protein
MRRAASAPSNDMIDPAASPEGVGWFAQSCCRNADAWCCLCCCQHYLCAYLPHDSPSRAALMNRFYSHGADSKTKSPEKHERPAKPALVNQNVQINSNAISVGESHTNRRRASE